MIFFGLFHYKGDITISLNSNRYVRRGVFIYTTTITVILLGNGIRAFLMFTEYESVTLDIIFVLRMASLFWALEAAMSCLLMYITCWKKNQFHKICHLVQIYKNQFGSQKTFVSEILCTVFCIGISLSYIFAAYLPGIITPIQNYNDLLISASIQFPLIKDEIALRIVGVLNLAFLLHILGAVIIPAQVCFFTCCAVGYQFREYCKHLRKVVAEGTLDDEQFKRFYDNYQQIAEITSVTDMTFRHINSVTLLSSLATACFCVYAMMIPNTSDKYTFTSVDMGIMIYWTLSAIVKAMLICIGPTYLTFKVRKIHKTKTLINLTIDKHK